MCLAIPGKIVSIEGLDDTFRTGKVSFGGIIKNEQIKTQNELISLQINQNKLLENEVEKKTLKLTKLVKERELLVKEVFHRVKNNFTFRS